MRVYVPQEILSRPVTVKRCIKNPYQTGFYNFRISVNPKCPDRIPGIAKKSTEPWEIKRDKLYFCMENGHIFKHIAVGTILMIPVLNFFIYIGLAAQEKKAQEIRDNLTLEVSGIDSVKEVLMDEIDEWKSKSQKYEEALEKLKSLVMEDPELFQMFMECRGRNYLNRRAKNYFNIGKSRQSIYDGDDPTRVEWENEMNKFYDLREYVRFLDFFLEQNPKFYAALKEALNGQAQPSILEAISKEENSL